MGKRSGVNTLVETLQRRIAELETQSLEQQRTIARYENARIVLSGYWRSYHRLMDRFVRGRDEGADYV